MCGIPKVKSDIDIPDPIHQIFREMSLLRCFLFVSNILSIPHDGAYLKEKKPKQARLYIPCMNCLVWNYSCFMTEDRYYILSSNFPFTAEDCIILPS